MPQIWMTYEELGQLLNCAPQAAREVACRRSLDRKRSRDGFSRAKLDAEMMAVFMDRIRAQPDDLDRSIEELRHLHAEMKLAGPDRPPAVTPSSGWPARSLTAR